MQNRAWPGFLLPGLYSNPMASIIEKPKLIALFTDFGVTGPYLGQMQAVLAAAGVEQPVIQLMADAPRFSPRLSAYLLAAIANGMPPGSLIISVVDPGVGGDRRAIMVKGSGKWFIGPDNGLLSQVAKRSGKVEIEEIVWRPEQLSNSFHGRDLFAPVAAAICNQQYRSGPAIRFDALTGSRWPDDLAEIIYIDDFGNAITGISASGVARDKTLELSGVRIRYARTFSEVPVGEAFWYENSMGLVEVAVNQGDASQRLGLAIGSSVAMEWCDRTL